MKRTVKRNNLSILLILSLCFLGALPGVNGAQPPLGGPTPKYGGVLVCAQGINPKTLNTAIVYDMAGQRMGAVLVHDMLVTTDANYKVIPELARSWDVSPDAKEYTFYLVDNAKWHDGVPFTAEDVKYTFEAKVVNKAPKYEVLENVESYEIIDDYTIKIVLKTPNAAFLSDLSDPFSAAFIIIPKHLYEGTDWETNPYSWEPIGTGPFKFLEWVRGSHITLVANEDYWMGRPYLDKIIYKIMPSAASRIAALEAGEVQFAEISVEEFLRLSEDDRFKTGLYGSPIVTMIAMNQYVEPWDDVRVRWAIAYAINRTDVVLKFQAGLAKEAWNMYIPDNVFTDPDLRYPETNLTKAEELLDEAGYYRDANGIRFDIPMVTHTGGGDWAFVVAEQLAAVGLRVSVDSFAWPTYYEKVVERRDYEFGALGGFQGPDINELRHFLRSDGYRNIGHYDNPRVDEIFDMGVYTGDLEERKELYYEMQQYLLDEMPRICLYQISYRMAGNRDFNFFWEPNAPLAGFIDHAWTWWSFGEEIEPTPPEPPTPTNGEIEEKVEALDSAVQSLVSQIDSLNSKISSIETLISDIPTETVTPDMTISYVAVIMALVAIGLSLYFRK